MPLKHLTETVLIVLLTVLTIVTGIVVSLLPNLPEGFMPWVILTAVTVLYPVVLYPMLRSNRADYPFRVLHFAPMAIAAGWMLLQMAVLKDLRLTPVARAYVWGWGLLPVAVVLALLALFCLQVIRRRAPRIAFMLLLFVPFAALAVVAERSPAITTQLAALLRGRGTTVQSSSARSVTLALSSKGEKNLSTSSVPEEEAWREKLRSVEGGRVHSSFASLPNVQSPTTGVEATTSLIGPNGRRRVKLPKSGLEGEVIALLFIAGFCAVMHRRAAAAMMRA